MGCDRKYLAGGDVYVLQGISFSRWMVRSERAALLYEAVWYSETRSAHLSLVRPVYIARDLVQRGPYIAVLASVPLISYIYITTLLFTSKVITAVYIPPSFSIRLVVRGPPIETDPYLIYCTKHLSI